MTQQHVHRPERSDGEHIEEVPQVEKRDLSDIDRLLDEIDEVLDTDEQQEIERQRFKEKIKSLAIGRLHCCGACAVCPLGRSI